MELSLRHQIVYSGKRPIGLKAPNKDTKTYQHPYCTYELRTVL